MTSSFNRSSSLFFTLTLLLSIGNLYAVVDDITGDVGTAQTGAVTLTGGVSGAFFDSTTPAITLGFNFISMPLTTSSNGQIIISGETVLHSYGPGNQNIFVGSFAGNFSLNTGSSAFNTGCGANALNVLTTGAANTAVGHASLISLTEGVSNVSVGDQSGTSLTTGNSNTLIGAQAGTAYASNESFNIILGNHTGIVNESFTTRIGGANQQACYIDGIFSATVDPSTALPVFVDGNGKLGTIVSSITLKTNIRNIGNDSTPILKFRPISFHFKSDKAKVKQYGLIAEEVEQLMPELVVKDSNGNAMAVKYYELPVLILNEFQKMATRVDKLESRIQKLLTRIEKLEACSPCA